MHLIKRKAAPSEGSHPAKVAKTSKNLPRPSKSAANAPTSDLPDTTPLTKSILTRDEEPLFPRGGASILNPLERREIDLRAKSDALNEDELGATEARQNAHKEKKKITVRRRRWEVGRVESERAGIKVESLNFKKLAQGSLVLAQVVEISPLDVTLALPNNLLGYASIVALSDHVTKIIQQEAAAEYNNEVGNNEEEYVQSPELQALFRIGQFLRASVISTGEEFIVGKSRRRIQLSLRPCDANSGLTSEDIVANGTVMASVLSVEEHGCVMDIGMGTDLSGFLPRKQTDPATRKNQLQPGAVFLCSVKDKSYKGGVVQLSTLPEILGSTRDIPREASTINTFLPGTLVDMLVTTVSARGLTGRILGSLDATADVVHSGAGPLHVNLETKHKVGSRVKARVVCNFLTSDTPKVGVSILPHILSLGPQKLRIEGKDRYPLEMQPISSLVEQCTVCHIDEQNGLYVDVGLPGACGFVHISRVTDGKIDTLFQTSGPYQVNSVHRGRVIGYNPVDGLLYLSLEQSFRDQKYIRLEDVPVGAVVSGEIDKINMDHEGVSSLIVNVSADISGLVVSKHFADVQLRHPEKMFREGMKVKARVLFVDLVKRQMRLTLKKTLVNSDAPTIDSYDKAKVGMQIPGTIIKIDPVGAQIRFYGELKGFLPTSEMSEAYIVSPGDHFRIGQVVSVYVLEVNVQLRRLIVSCKNPSAFGLEKQAALRKLNVGDMVSGKIMAKSESDVYVDVVDGNLKAILPVGQLGDKSFSKSRAAWKRLYVGQTLTNLMVLGKHEARHSIILTMKPSLLTAKKESKLIATFDEAREGMVAQGFVRNIVSTGVVVGFGGNVHGILPRSRLSKESREEKDLGMEKYQPIEVVIRSLDRENKRMLVLPCPESKQPQQRRKDDLGLPYSAVNSVDESIRTVEDLEYGTITKARIHSVKDTQLNVRIADNRQARIDISQIFDSWNDIPKPGKPLEKFQAGQIVKVRVIGVHDARNHKFLPFSHRSTHSILELSAKPSDLEGDVEPLSLERVDIGASYVGFVNNVTPNCIWVNLSPNLRGRISAADASDDISQLADLHKSFPIGSAIMVHVRSKDVEKNHLDLTARSYEAQGTTATITWEKLEQNMVVPGRVTKVTERQIIVQLSDSVSGPVHLPDMCDNFIEVNVTKWKKNDIIHVATVEVDKNNKRLRLSTRQSRILSSTLPVIDPEIIQASQLRGGDHVRGFVKNVSDKGLFVLLGGSVTAMVKISNLSDRFVKKWKDDYQVDQLVKGRVISVDPTTGQIDLSLKASVVDSHYIQLKKYTDFEKGDVVTGKIRRVEEFGAFIVIDESENVSGLCHRSQMADEPVKDAKKLYSEGDVVKAFILDIDAEKKRILFGLKPSLFEDGDLEMVDLLSEEETARNISFPGFLLPRTAESAEIDSDCDENCDADGGGLHGLEVANSGAEEKNGVEVLDKTKYNWMGNVFEDDGQHEESGRRQKDDKTVPELSDRRKKVPFQVDRTAMLDAHGPQSASDYERLLLGQQDSSALWIAYMALQMQVSDLVKARETAERAICTINVREETEKLNVWVAYLNLEVAYGSKNSVDNIFARACRTNDEQEIHERLASIYIQSERHEDAETLFESMAKKFGSKSPQVWINYAHFLHVTIGDPARARALLPRATQALESRHHVHLSTRFAALEFRSPHGEPERGRTMFEGLLATFPKKGDVWNQLLDLEIGMMKTIVKTDRVTRGETVKPFKPISDSAGAVKIVRDVFERRTKVHGLRPKQAVIWFGKWADWEEQLEGSKKGREKVVAKTKEWVDRLKSRKEDAEIS